MAPDLVLAVRSLRRRPGSSLAAIGTLALGIGAATAIFTVVHGVLLRPLPFPDPDRIVRVWQIGRNGGFMQTSEPTYEEWEARQRVFSDLARWGGGSASIVAPSGPVRVRLSRVSADFLAVYGVEPILGRWFSDEERTRGSAPVAVVSHRFWRHQLGAPADLAAVRVRADGLAVPVVGVLPEGFDEPHETSVWTPAEAEERNPHRTGHNWYAIARLAPGVDLATAAAEMRALGQWQQETWGEETWLRGVALEPLRDSLVGPVRRPLWLLQVAGLLLLLIAATNVGTILLGGAESQRRELAVRAALGAGDRQLARIHLGRALALCVPGGVAGWALSALGVPVLLRVEPGDLPLAAQIRLHPSILLFTLVLVALTVAIVCTLSAWRMRDHDLRAILAEGDRGGAGGDRRVQGALVVGQIATTLVLLVGAGLLGRSFLGLLEVDPGFATRSAVIATVHLEPARTQEDLSRLASFHRRCVDELERLPGVVAVGAIDAHPLLSSGADGQFRFADAPDEVGQADYRVVTPGWFEAMGVPLLAGRLPESSDDAASPHVAVISRRLQEIRWPDRDPLGARILFGNMDGHEEPITVVGVVGDVRQDGLDARPRGTVYVVAGQRPRRTAHLTWTVRTDGPPGTAVSAVRETLRRIAPEAPVRLDTLHGVVHGSIADRRFQLLLLGLLAGTALLLAAAGIFGVALQAVAQRRVEIGIRLALGATPREVQRLVLTQGVRWAAAGLAIGFPAALAFSRLLRGQLVGVRAHDPGTLLLVAGLVIAATLLACRVPARRAASVDPVDVLRDA